ncbi:alkaline phosphatase PafA [Flavicella sp.]|uniref:alkaline phosphatase PafA n=1 Tax=Flavicella sp. TaxID=2957742 RepID=UPI0030187178
MKKSILILFLFLISFKISYSQKTNKPKLVIGLVIDQMRYDYLYRFSEKYGDKGFKRLLKEGFHLENTHYNYIPTKTAVGHSSIYTGTTPQNHGIIGNNWYDKSLKQSIYCVDDSNYNSVGTNGTSGQKSPYKLHTTTITDQLRLAQNLKGKTISIAIKDRSAILPGGHTANAAYWFEGGEEGNWITSSFYMETLPEWVIKFNNNGNVEHYLNQSWDTYYPIETYTESIIDNNPYEGTFIGESKPVFPHNIPELKKLNDNFSLLKMIPAGNSITTDFTIAAIEGEQLGQSNEQIDFLAISYSSTDYVGHRYGVDSKEIEDTYIRMDLEIARLLTYLDKHIGKNEYTLFLTADHAVAQTPNYLNSLKIPGGYFDDVKFNEYIKSLSLKQFNSDKIIENISNYQLFFDKAELKRLNLQTIDVENFFAEELLNFDKVYKTITAHTLQTSEFTQGIYGLVQQGYNQKRSGNVFIIPDPSVIGSGNKKTGTTHGSGYSYDTHVPLIFFGFGIKQGSSNKYYPIIDIAPTLANLLQIEFPNGVTGKIIDEALEHN